MIRFRKYHALGNDYLVISPDDIRERLNARTIERICNRNFGVGSDGILVGPIPSKQADYALRIFNPDGSEAEKSGNGLRIFARALLDHGLVGYDEFSLETLSGLVKVQLLERGRSVRIEMGRVSFVSSEIPIVGERREVIMESLAVSGRTFEYCGATVGNPHCVIPVSELSKGLAIEFGPAIERHINFPKRTNLQFMKVLDRGAIQLEIWERGAGYTLASGSSSCAAAGVARKLGLCDDTIRVVMPGGELLVEVGDSFEAVLTGPVTFVCEGVIAHECLE